MRKRAQSGYPLSQEISEFPAAEFYADFRPQYLATKQDVLAALEDSSICLINSLKAENFREARIPGSVNIPFVELLHPENGMFVELDVLRNKFHKHGNVEHWDSIICYCGSGITACVNAFALSMLGRERVAVYDGSMSEWIADEALPVAKE